MASSAWPGDLVSPSSQCWGKGGPPHIPNFLYDCWGSELWSSRSCDKHFQPLRRLPSHQGSRRFTAHYCIRASVYLRGRGKDKSSYSVEFLFKKSFFIDPSQVSRGHVYFFPLQSWYPAQPACEQAQGSLLEDEGLFRRTGRPFQLSPSQARQSPVDLSVDRSNLSVSS